MTEHAGRRKKPPVRTDLTGEELERRLGLGGPAGTGSSPSGEPPGEAGPQTGAESVVDRQASPVRVRSRSRRALSRGGLVRDTLTILGGAVLAIIAAQLVPGGTPSTALASPTPVDSGVIVGSFEPGLTMAPLDTLGPVVNPSVGIEATPTPVPYATLPPKHTPKPTAKPTPKPHSTPKPTSKPTPTAPPPVIAVFTCTWNGGTMHFTDQSTGNPASWNWQFGDGGNSTQQNPTHDYGGIPGGYTVSLTVSGPGGSNHDERLCTVP